MYYCLPQVVARLWPVCLFNLAKLLPSRKLTMSTRSDAITYARTLCPDACTLISVYHSLSLTMLFFLFHFFSLFSFFFFFVFISFFLHSLLLSIVPLQIFKESPALVMDKGVEAVYVAAPQGSHKLYADLIVKNKKAAFFEAPLGRTAQECGQIMAAFEKQSLPLYVGYGLRSQPRAKAVRDALMGGAIGTLTSVSYAYMGPQLLAENQPRAAVLLSPERCGGGLFVYHGAAVLDLLDYILGPLGAIKGDALCHHLGKGEGKIGAPRSPAASSGHAAEVPKLQVHFRRAERE